MEFCVTWNLAQNNLEKNLEFRTKNLEKTWNLVFGKKCEPCNRTMKSENMMEHGDGTMESDVGTMGSDDGTMESNVGTMESDDGTME